jgi:hypothetical protein
MDFANLTDFPAKMAAGSTGETEMLYVVACKVTYALDRSWLVPVPPDQAWPVFDNPFFFEGITLGPEMDFRKNGVDLLVFGCAVAPHSEPARHMRIGVECGRLCHHVEIFGERFWSGSGKKLVPSNPEPFLEMPLTNDRAFGGTGLIDGLEMPHAVNPAGKGFYLSASDAAGKCLPNLERPDSLIQRWEDQPRPACFFKPAGNLEAGDSTTQDSQARVIRLLESGFNQTVPELVARREDLGSHLRLTGFSADGSIVFPMPRLSGPTVHASAGALRSCFPSIISSLVVLAPERVVVVTYLCLVRYLFRPMEKRHIELRWTESSKVGPIPGR